MLPCNFKLFCITSHCHVLRWNYKWKFNTELCQSLYVFDLAMTLQLQHHLLYLYGWLCLADGTVTTNCLEEVMSLRQSAQETQLVCSMDGSILHKCRIHPKQYHKDCTLLCLTHLPRDKRPPFWQKTFSNVFSWMKMIQFCCKFHWNLLLGVQLTINEHWFR